MANHYAEIKHKAEKLLEWARQWEGFNDYLKLNALVNAEGDASLNVIANDRVVTQFIDGSAIREFTAQFKLVTAWSDGYDNTNVEAQNYLSGLIDWLNDQYPENVPSWPDAAITKIETQDNAPSLDFVHEQDELAEYSVQVIITYEE